MISREQVERRAIENFVAHCHRCGYHDVTAADFPNVSGKSGYIRKARTQLNKEAKAARNPVDQCIQRLLTTP